MTKKKANQEIAKEGSSKPSPTTKKLPPIVDMKEPLSIEIIGGVRKPKNNPESSSKPTQTTKELIPIVDAEEHLTIEIIGGVRPPKNDPENSQKSSKNTKKLKIEFGQGVPGPVTEIIGGVRSPKKK